MPYIPRTYPHVRQFETPELRRQRALAAASLAPARPPRRRRWHLVLRPAPTTCWEATTMTTALDRSTAQLFHRRAGTEESFWGPGDRYTFLVTGEETGGAYFVMEAWGTAGRRPRPAHHAG